MKAWKVGFDRSIGVWLVHADTAGKAKRAALKHTDMCDFDPEFTELRAYRAKELDDKPFTIENAEKVLEFPDSVDEDGNPYTGEFCTREEYENRCPCETCKASQ